MDKMIKEIQTVLVHQVGDARVCPHCDKPFVPVDSTTAEAKRLYDKIEKKRTQRKLKCVEAIARARARLTKYSPLCPHCKASSVQLLDPMLQAWRCDKCNHHFRTEIWNGK